MKKKGFIDTMSKFIRGKLTLPAAHFKQELLMKKDPTDPGRPLRALAQDRIPFVCSEPRNYNLTP